MTTKEIKKRIKQHESAQNQLLTDLQMEYATLPKGCESNETYKIGKEIWYIETQINVKREALLHSRILETIIK